mgnify:CR=1 FL=1
MAELIGLPKPPAVGATISMFVVMLVIMTETTADILAIGQVIDKPADRQTVTTASVL